MLRGLIWENLEELPQLATPSRSDCDGTRGSSFTVPNKAGYRPNPCISHFYLTEKVALAVQILKNQNAF